MRTRPKPASSGARRRSISPSRRNAVPPQEAAAQTLRDWLASGPYTLVLSSGFCAMHHHAAVLSALIEAGLPPTTVAGSSAGACIAALHAAGMTPEQMAALMADPPDIVELARPWREPGGLLSSKCIVRALEDIVARHGLGATLEQCMVPVSLSTFSLRSLRTHALNGGQTRLAEAIVASLAVPPLFAPLRLPDLGFCTDGGIGDFPGIAGVASNERVLYHHASVLPLSIIDSLYIGAARSQRRSLSIGGLPWCNPLSLRRVGPKAFEAAREATMRALCCPAGADATHVHVRSSTWPLGLGLVVS